MSHAHLGLGPATGPQKADARETRYRDPARPPREGRVLLPSRLLQNWILGISKGDWNLNFAPETPSATMPGEIPVALRQHPEVKRFMTWRHGWAD